MLVFFSAQLIEPQFNVLRTQLFPFLLQLFQFQLHILRDEIFHRNLHHEISISSINHKNIDFHAHFDP